MARLIETLTRPGSDWRARAPALEADEIDGACALIGRALPEGLVELYRARNGGEGSLPFQPWGFVLWGLEDVVLCREDAFYREHYDAFVFFGSNGAGEYFGLDPAGRVFFMDAFAGEESIVFVAESFDEFARQVGSAPPGGFP